jgi:hypothetical protein
MAEIKRFKYKNQSEHEQVVMGVGTVAPGKIIESDAPISNPNLVLVEAGRMVNVEAPVEQPKVNKTLKG